MCRNSSDCRNLHRISPSPLPKTVCTAIKKSGSSLITKAFVLRLKHDLTWPVFNNSSNKFKIHARLSKVRIRTRAASLNDRKDRKKDKFFAMVYAGSSFGAKSYAAVAGGDNSCYKKLNAAIHDKYD